MASPTLTAREKEINKFIKHLGLDKIQDVQYVQAENRKKINKEQHNTDFDIKYYDSEILPNGVSTDDIDRAILRAKNTERFFRFALWRVAFPLLLDISHDDYSKGRTIINLNIKSDKKELEAYEDDIEAQIEKIEASDAYIKDLYTDPENCYIDITQKYHDWKSYCKTIDVIPIFMREYHNDYSDLRISEKKKIIEKLKSTSITQPIADYLEQYSSLTQTKMIQAKEDKLLSLKLPKLDNKRIVEKFVEIYTQNKDIQI